MIPLLAKNAVQIKCGFSNAVMTGNYECAYALGVLEALVGLEHAQGLDTLADLHKRILSAAKDYEPKCTQEERLLEMLKEYEPSSVSDDQIKELYDSGFADKNI